VEKLKEGFTIVFPSWKYQVEYQPRF